MNGGSRSGNGVPGARGERGAVAWILLLLALVVTLGACAAAGPVATARPIPTPVGAIPGPFEPEPPADWSGPTVRMGDLPREALEMLDLVALGGPYPYPQDDGVFGNREGLLPDRPTGTYREYTVVTPGSPDRGARRLVVGGYREPYYTDDHYATFRYVVP